jgi:hypothetical protein
LVNDAAKTRHVSNGRHRVPLARIGREPRPDYLVIKPGLSGDQARTIW